MALFDMDDGYFAGPIEPMMEVVKGFQERLKKHVGAVLNLSKCQMWNKDPTVVSVFLQDHPQSEFKQGVMTLPDGEQTYGMKVSGVPFGDDKYVGRRMQDKVETVVSQISVMATRLQHDSKQNLYALLVQCLNTKIQF